MRNAIRILTVAFIGWIASAAAGSTIRLNFTLDPDETLPFVPVNFRVRAMNMGSAPAMLPLGLRLESRTGADGWGSICFIDRETNGCAEPLPVDMEDGPPWIELAPGEERVLDYLAGPYSPRWMSHSDLMKPGTYRLRLVTWGDYPEAEAIVSNEVVLTIGTPTGADAAAWELIRAAPFSRAGFADQLWSLYPHSVYTAITPRNVPQDDWQGYLDAYTEVLGKNPPAGFADAFKYEIARAHTYLMDDAVHEFNVQKAFEHADAARALFQELATKETDSRLKAKAAEPLVDDGLTRAVVEESIAELRGSSPRQCERLLAKTWRSELATHLDSASDKAKTALSAAIADLDKYEAEAGRTPPDMHAALASIEQAASRIETAVKAQWIASEHGTKILKGFAELADLSATKAIDASAADAGAKKSDLALAKRKLEEGRAAVQAGDFKKAISRFREALHKAQGASSARGAFC